MERTIGTISGGVLGLAISLLGHGFGQDSDMVFTGARLQSHLIDEMLQNVVKRGSTARNLQLASMMTPCTMLTDSVYLKTPHSDTR